MFKQFTTLILIIIANTSMMAETCYRLVYLRSVQCTFYESRRLNFGCEISF